MKGTKPASASPVARPTMFCSATPTLKKRSGKRARNGSRTMKPRSPVEQDAFVAAASSATRVYEGFPQLAASTSRIAISNSCVAHRQIVPVDRLNRQVGLGQRDALLHIRDALAEHGAGEHNVRERRVRRRARSSPSARGRNGRRPRRRASRKRATVRRDGRMSITSRVWPSACWPFQSTITCRLPRRWWAANIAASQTEPSLHSASLIRP